jgi:hypothetical protein
MFKKTSDSPINILEEFNPYIGIAVKDDTTVVTFDSNYYIDVNREPKVIFLKNNYLQKGGSISIKLGDVALIDAPNVGAMTVNADINLYASLDIHCQDDADAKQSFTAEEKITLHQLQLLIPNIDQVADANSKLRLIISDKIADAVATAFDNSMGDTLKKTVYPSTIKDITKNKYINVKFITLVLATALIMYAGYAFMHPEQKHTSEVLESPEAINAQVELTRETLKSMGLDTSEVQSDLGCLAK